MLFPSIGFVILIAWLGIYVASFIYVGGFMLWQGKYGWLPALAVSAGVPIVLFLRVRAVVPRAAAQGSGRAHARFLSDGNAPKEPRVEDLGNLMQGFAVALTWKNLLFMLVGILLGVLIGVLPGLGGANGVAILLPLTFTMPPTSAIIMLSCIYWGALFGGAITSILFNIPGEPWSVATTFDGYPMAQKGRAAEAMTAAFTSSFVGALFAVDHDHFSRAAGRAVRAAVRAAGVLRRPAPDVLQLRRHGHASRR